MTDVETVPLGTLAELLRVRVERDALALVAHVERLREELRDRAVQAWCGCEHPACKRCRDDADTERVLAEKPATSLARLRARHRWEKAYEIRDRMVKALDRVRDEASLELIEDRATEAALERRQAEEKS